MWKSVSLAVFILWPAVALSQGAHVPWKPSMDIVTGQDWLDACQLDKADLDTLTATVACDYYMKGVIQTTYSTRLLSYQQNQVPDAKQVDFYCAPPGTTMRERVAAITAYMARYPALKVGPAPMGITMGLQAGFPCPSGR